MGYVKPVILEHGVHHTFVRVEQVGYIVRTVNGRFTAFLEFVSKLVEDIFT